MLRRHLSLPRFVAGVLFIDDVNAAFAFHDFAIDVALFQRLERVGNFHDRNPYKRARKVGAGTLGVKRSLKLL